MQTGFGVTHSIRFHNQAPYLVNIGQDEVSYCVLRMYIQRVKQLSIHTLCKCFSLTKSPRFVPNRGWSDLC